MDTTKRDASPDDPSAAPDGPGGLSEALLAGDPMTQFARWMADAEAAGACPSRPRWCSPPFPPKAARGPAPCC